MSAKFYSGFNFVEDLKKHLMEHYRMTSVYASVVRIFTDNMIIRAFVVTLRTTFGRQPWAQLGGGRVPPLFQTVGI